MSGIGVLHVVIQYIPYENGQKQSGFFVDYFIVASAAP